MQPPESWASIEKIVQDHYGLVYRFAYRLCGSAIDAEDLTQQTFLAVQRKLDQLREPEKLRSWLFKITHNSFLKTFRKPGNSGWTSLESIGEPVAPSLMSPIDQEALQAALFELPPEYRVPLVLFYFEDLSYREIADQLEIPAGTVMSRLSRAKEHLRRILSESAPELVEVVGLSKTTRQQGVD